MASKIFIKNGQVTAVYDDRLMPIFKALGDVTIRRASEVEFDDFSENWVAIRHTIEWEAEQVKGQVEADIPVSRIIAEGPNRNEVIKQEVQFLESEMEKK